LLKNISPFGYYYHEKPGPVKRIPGPTEIGKARFFTPRPKNTRDLKRYAISLRVFTAGLKDVYQEMAVAQLPAGLKMAYLQDFVEKIPGVLSTTVNLIERTRPLVSYETWKRYTTKHRIIPSWDEQSMIGQFQQ